MKTLIVKYIPRNEQPNTKKLLNASRGEISISDIEELAEGMAKKEGIKQTNLNKSIRQVRVIAREWYRKEGGYDSMSANVISKNTSFGNV
jgi:hypothetical protein